jgi:hypothetical protein
VKDVRPVDVHHRTIRMTNGVAISCNVGTGVEHHRAVAGLGQLACHHGT